MSRNLIKLFILGYISVLNLTACLDQSYDQSKNKRNEIASNSKDGDPIVIGIAWRKANDLFIQGVKLAVKEINNKGGILNSRLEILINDSESQYSDPNLSVSQRNDVILNIANSFASNPKLIAVIGHSSSTIAITSSVVYQNNGILFLAPNATNAKLTGHNFQYVFRTIPNNEEMGQKLADYAYRQGYKNIAILHGRGDYETELADAFVTYSVERYHTNIVYRRSFFNSTIDIISLIIDLKSLQNIDALFIASNSQLSAKIYQKGREMGLKSPVFGGETLDTKIFSDQLYEWENDRPEQKKSSIPTVFNASDKNNQDFIKRFKQEYGAQIQPDYLAALGYDTINLLAHGIQRAQSRVPLEIAVTLRYMGPCKGVAGRYEFQRSGDLKSKALYFKQLVNNEYIYSKIDEANVDESKLEICNQIDRDGDTIPNDIDSCPDNTKQEIAKGIVLDGVDKGCPIDRDRDGILDYKDNCIMIKIEESDGTTANNCQ
jgi:branched-chain amino acid transport system substrate-binding protein